MTCCIYVIGGLIGPLKLGIARDAEKRRVALQCMSPSRLQVLYCGQVSSVTLARQVEQRAHKLLHYHRDHAEWFNMSVQMGIDAIVLASCELDVPLSHLVDPRFRTRPFWPDEVDAKRADAWMRSLRSRRYARQRALAARD